MCRFLAYKGKEIPLADLATKPENSLITQSYKAKERSEPLNGDGFGLGWYVPEIDPTPSLFTSITPAWSNKNLYRLAERSKSSCIFAHVRAAAKGGVVSEQNCHPFQCGKFLWMHNGDIAQFIKIKRRLRESLSDEYYNFILGTTDTEHAFALFLNNLGDHMGEYTPQTLQKTMLTTINQINEWTRQAGIAEASYFNFAVTDGESVVATRYVSDPDQNPASLYYSQGSGFECHDGVCHWHLSEKDMQAVIIASEPLTTSREGWEPIPKNHVLVLNSELDITLVPIE